MYGIKGKVRGIQGEMCADGGRELYVDRSIDEEGERKEDVEKSVDGEERQRSMSRRV